MPGGLISGAPGLLIPLLLLLAWHLGTLGEHSSLVPTPLEVLHILAHPFTDILATGTLAWSVSVSLMRVAMGFLLAALIAIPLGSLMGSLKIARSIMWLIVEMSLPISPLALIPLSLILFRARSFVEVFGLDALRFQRHILHEMQLGMVLILFWGAFFPILLSTIQGVRSIRRVHIEAARMLGADRFCLFRRVTLPSALPSIFTGLRLGIGRAWMVIIAAEMLPGTNAGLGYLIRYSYEVLRMDVMAASLVLVALFGALFSRGLEAFGDRFLRLKVAER